MLKKILFILFLTVFIGINPAITSFIARADLGLCEFTSNLTATPNYVTSGTQTVAFSWYGQGCVGSNMILPSGSRVYFGPGNGAPASRSVTNAAPGQYTLLGDCDAANGGPECAIIQAEVLGQSTVNVTGCAEGGTWTLDKTNVNFTHTYFTGSPASVTATTSVNGTPFALNYTPPSGYTVSNINPASSLNAFPGNSYTFVASCTPISPIPTVTVSASPSSLSCPATSDISWTSSNATSCTLNGSSVSTSGTQTVSVAYPSQTYTVSCTGPGGSNSSAATVTVSASSCAVFDYYLTNTGDITATNGTVGAPTNTITRHLVSGTPESTDINVTGYPVEVGWFASPQICTPSPNSCDSVVSFNVPADAPTGDYPITVTGSPLNKITSFTLHILPSPNVTVSCTPSAATAKVGETVTWTGTVSGGVPPYTYSWSGSNVPNNPAPNSSAFNISYSTVGTKTAQLTATDSNGAQGTCNPAGSIKINFKPVFKEL